MQDSAPRLQAQPPCAAPSTRRQWLAATAGSSLLAVLGSAASTAAQARSRRSAAPAQPADQRPERRGEHLPQALRRLVEATGLPLHSMGLYIQPVGHDAAPLASLNAERAYQLASTAKLVTSLAALDLLGPSYRWRTPAFAPGALQDGRLLGDLTILGGGDALLSSEDLLTWFGQMRAQGLREVRGNIVLDRLAFGLTDADLASTPAPGPDRPHHAWPDALMLDEGRLRLLVQSVPGRQPRLALQPPVSGLRLDAELSPSRGLGSPCELRADLRVPRPGELANRLVLRGQWGAGCGSRELQLSPWPHGVYTLRAVDALWREAGGRLRGSVVEAAADGSALAWPRGPDGRALQPWSVHRSEPLAQWLRDMNKVSDNLAARNLMLSLAPGFPLRVATLPAARARVQQWLRGRGLGAGDIVVDSGSGLSREERGKPRALVQLLRQAWLAPQRQDFVASLPVAGVDGTLQHRMTQGPATGRAFLKTGTLLDTRALAGYVLGKNGRAYAVTALVNHPQAQRALPLLDGMVQWLANQG